MGNRKRSKRRDHPRSQLNNPNGPEQAPPPQRDPHQQRTSWVKKSHWKRNSVILGFVLLVIVIGAFSVSRSTAGSSARPIQVLNAGWKTAQLTDANTGSNFTLSQFSGKVVVLQFMAVYCQYCLAEAHQLVNAQQSLAGNSQANGQIVIVSVDVDPNPNDRGQLKAYVTQNHFGAPNSNPAWYFATDDTGQLLKSVVGSVDFSSFISQTNMYFIDKNQSSTFFTMQRTTLQDANPASDIIAAAEKLF